MEFDKKLLQRVKNLMLARYPRFGGEIASINLEYKTDLKYHTAATDGKNIYFDPDYLASLSGDERLFIIAHELMHIKFEHMYRIKGRDGKMRDLGLWNKATDAIINANLERDGFKIKEGYVNMPEALNYSAEELYDKLLRERKAQEQSPSYKQQNGQGQSDTQDEQGNQQSGQGNGLSNNQSQQGRQENDGKGSTPNFWKGYNGDQQGAGASSKEEGQSNSSQSGQTGQRKEGQEMQSGNEQSGGMADDHSLWEEAFKERFQDEERSEEKTGKDRNKQSQSHKLSPDTKIPEFDEVKFDEKRQFQENREERRERARHSFEKLRNDELLKTDGESIEFGEVGQAKPILDWKLLLRREVEKSETIWSQRRSIAENNYAYRLEENDVEDQAETEVMIDVSGSVSLEMVKAFLRQLKPILKESKLRVGCFNANFWGMVEIKSNRDIDNFKIPAEARGHSAWTEDWDLAVRSFSKKREVNKIVFTDGDPCPGNMPKEDLKGINVIWLVYRNRDFKSGCGKVIDIYPKDLQSMINLEQDFDDLEPTI